MKKLYFFVFATFFIEAAEQPNRSALIDLAAKKGVSLAMVDGTEAQLLLAQGTKPPAIPLRFDSRLRRQSLQPDSTSSEVQEATNINLPKSIPLTPLLRAQKPLKMVTINVNVWHEDPCDEQLWHEILIEYFKLKNSPFNPQELFAGINEFIKLTEEKKGKALWGGLSFTELVDSQKVDEQKLNP